MNDLRELDRELAKILPGSPYDDAISTWYSRTFNTLDWLSFLINEKLINEKVVVDRKLIQHIKPIIVRYYEDTFLKNASVNERDSKTYQELKNLSNNQEVGLDKQMS
jgi:hypothetical protein